MNTKKSIRRLIQYRYCLKNFKKLGFDKIFSSTLSKEAGVSPEQVRKDFSIFEISGNKRGGYDIETLLSNLDEILDTNRKENLILIGFGNIGKALAHYKQFSLDNLPVIAAFDIDPVKQSKKHGIPVYPIEKLDDIIQLHNVSVAIVAVPEVAAQAISTKLINLGIKGIINFASTILKVPEGIITYNIDIGSEIRNMVYHVHQVQNV